MICMPLLRNRGTLSGAGASTKSTWPERSAATRVFASGMQRRIKRDTRRIPVVRVLHEFCAIALDEPLQDERPRTRRTLSEAAPVTADFFLSARARIHDPA